MVTVRHCRAYSWALVVLALVAVCQAQAQLPGPPEFCTNDVLNRVAWGVASSAAQTEGGATAGGRSPSVWDANGSNGITGGSTPAVTCDSYNKFKSDVALMKQLGVKNYRLSISWSRLIPGAVKGSAISTDGMNFYNNLINELIANGISPAVTLYHWDLPQRLQANYTGFMSRKIIDDFVYYADIAFQKFGDRVKKWTTFNEPWVVCNLQYGGAFPPRYKDTKNFYVGKYTCGHNLLLAHGRAVQLYRQWYQKRQGGRIGMALWSEWSEPWSDSFADRRAAQNKMDIDFGWFADVIHFGDYPALLKQTASFLPSFSADEKALLRRSYDYLGLTLYTGKYAKAGSNTHSWTVTEVSATGQRIGEQAESYWLYNVPWSIYKMMAYVNKRFDKPDIWIMENGVSEKGERWRTGEAALRDPFRTKYLRGYIGQACRAVKDGIKMTHYFAWSFLDNWEWLEGFTTRFGLVYVDFTNPALPRKPKDSARWLQANVLTKSTRK